MKIQESSLSSFTPLGQTGIPPFNSDPGSLSSLSGSSKYFKSLYPHTLNTYYTLKSYYIYIMDSYYIYVLDTNYILEYILII